mmetsp:Transcript_15497/g.31654  ORF Transcript_15497/g.31654 Transcript_15497/m.31654 type:complete len:290 (+) Transcript_15497:256-1125(+)
MLTQIVHIPIGQHVVKQDGFARLGFDFDAIVELRGDGPREYGLSSSKRRSFRWGRRRRRRRIRRRIRGRGKSSTNSSFVEEIPLSRQIQQHRGKSPGLISIINGRIHEIVMRRVFLPGTVSQQLHRFDDAMVRRQSIWMFVFAIAVVVVVSRRAIPEQLLLHAHQIGRPSKHGIDHDVVLAMDPSSGGRARVRFGRASDGDVSGRGDGGRFHGDGGTGGEVEEVLDFDGGEEFGDFEDAGCDAEDSQGEGRRVGSMVVVVVVVASRRGIGGGGIVVTTVVLPPFVSRHG